MNVYCPECPQKHLSVIKFGYYIRKSDSKKIQRYQCRFCNRHFSAATFSACYNQKKRRLNILIYKSLCSQVSIRRCAKLYGTTKNTVQKKLVFLAQQIKLKQQKSLEKKPNFQHIQFDDLETFEHSKAKPITVCMVVEYKTRKIIDFCVAPIGAKGLLAKSAKKKYGLRRNFSQRERKKMFSRLQKTIHPFAKINSDQNPYYLPLILKYFPKANYETYKGLRSTSTAQGELKRVKFDPLFSINHTLAMLRANINRLIRKTWCTTKKLEALSDHLSLYMHYHNETLLP